jgi:AbrB family looped-hinge helix DNA binding protein
MVIRMQKEEEVDITVVSEKGQVVIPHAIRKRLGIGPKTKLLIYGYQDTVIMKKLEVPDVSEQLQAIFKEIDKRNAELGELSMEEINEIVHDTRKKRDHLRTLK